MFMSTSVQTLLMFVNFHRDDRHEPSPRDSSGLADSSQVRETALLLRIADQHLGDVKFGHHTLKMHTAMVMAAGVARLGICFSTFAGHIASSAPRGVSCLEIGIHFPDHRKRAGRVEQSGKRCAVLHAATLYARIPGASPNERRNNLSARPPRPWAQVCLGRTPSGPIFEASSPASPFHGGLARRHETGTL